MDLPKAQAILREHGLEDFPRPWIIAAAKKMLVDRSGAHPNVLEGAERFKWVKRYGSHAERVARETALLMGWKPKGKDDG